jgi:hypothetical protein
VGMGMLGLGRGAVDDVVFNLIKLGVLWNWN